MRIAIIGGGPAGSALAWRLARSDIHSEVFDDSHPREKACGGGVTWRGYQALPLLADLDLACVEVTSSWYVPPSLAPTRVPQHRPVRIYSRKELDLAILEAAVAAGVKWRKSRVREIKQADRGWLIDGDHFDFVVGADGGLGLTRRTFGIPFPATDRLICVGYLTPGEFPPEIWIEFCANFPGYAWFFPRVGWASIGVGTFDKTVTKHELYDFIHLFLARRFPDLNLTQAVRYGGFCPCLRGGRFADFPFTGDRWAQVGDAAGFCDPMTGEGLFYAFESANLLTQALSETDSPDVAAEKYRLLATERLLPELVKSSFFLEKFYRRWIMETAMFTIRHSKSAKALAARYIEGRQGLLTVKKNVLDLAPRVILELITGQKG